ncbi:MAG TPA: hypothetical protein VKX30_08685 [Flavobacteriaceae bacterium]|nr:hypothetical protein [Flavobacteriaceae bacterium]
MKNQDLTIDFRLVWLLVVGSILFISLGALAKVLHWEFATIYVLTGLVFTFSSWVILLSDMVKRDIYNKTFWIISMFLMPSIASIFYLIQRNRLLRLAQKF